MMKASDSTNSLTGLTEHVEITIEKNECFICLDEINEKKEPLVDSSLLRTCGCRFKVHPACWNEWMLDKTDYDCPICRQKSILSNKSPVPVVPSSEWQQEQPSFIKKAVYIIIGIIVLTASIAMIYEIVKE